MATRRDKVFCLWSRARRLTLLIFAIVVIITVQVHQFSKPRLVPLKRDLSPLDVKEEKVEGTGLGYEGGVHLDILQPWDDDGRRLRRKGKYKREKGIATYSSRTNAESGMRQTLEKRQKRNQNPFKEKQDSWWALQKEADDAFAAGDKAWNELQLLLANGSSFGERSPPPDEADVCRSTLTMSGWELQQAGQTMMLPCGLAAGSAITVIGKPRTAHMEYMPKISKVDETMSVAVSQFLVELQGLKIAHGDEEPPRILHFNPRVKGDWSQKPVIELNTCYHGQWGSGQRCDGTASPDDADTGSTSIVSAPYLHTFSYWRATEFLDGGLCSGRHGEV